MCEELYTHRGQWRRTRPRDAAIGSTQFDGELLPGGEHGLLGYMSEEGVDTVHSIVIISGHQEPTQVDTYRLQGSWLMKYIISLVCIVDCVYVCVCV